MAFNVSDVETMVKEHMSQQPYSCKCAACGADLEYDAKIDNDMDLTLTVTPCACTKTEDQQ